jgi:hypothetical protein
MTRKKKIPVVDIVISTFDDRYNSPVYRVIKETTLGKFTGINTEDYEPYGLTPLRDATAKFIGHLDSLKKKGRVVIGCLVDESGSMIGNRNAVVDGLNEFVVSMKGIEVDPNSDGKVLAVIFTDGLENASTEVSPQNLRNLIKEKESEDWSFIYLGSNQDAWKIGSEYGFSNESTGVTFTYESSSRGTKQAMKRAGGMGANFLSNNKSYASLSSSGLINEEGEILKREEPNV